MTRRDGLRAPQSPQPRRRAARRGLLAVLVLTACRAPGASDSTQSGLAYDDNTAIVVQNKETQPAYVYADAIRESVFVEAPIDSDGDGVLDRIALDIARPKTAPGMKVAIVMEASPYYRLATAESRGIAVPMLPLGH